MGHFPIAHISRPGEGTGHIQVAAGGDPGLAHLLSWQHTMQLELCIHALRLKDRILILCLGFSLFPTNVPCI
jgi:hypothetical protein